VHHIGDGKWHQWGEVSVAKMQKKIHCIICKAYILDRYEEMPFFYCMRCKREPDNRHIEMCVSCYNVGYLATGTREKIQMLSSNQTNSKNDSMSGQKMSGEIHHHTENVYRLNSDKATTSVARAVKICPNNCGYQVTWHKTHCCNCCANNHGVHGPRCEKKPVPGNEQDRGGRIAALKRAGSMDSMSSALSSNNWSGHGSIESSRSTSGIWNSERQTSGGLHSNNCGVHSFIPSGVYRGKISEGTGREVVYNLRFGADNSVSGIGPEKSTVAGKINDKKVKWIERYDWGALEVNSEWMEKKQFLKGTFVASDGGGGKLDLVPAACVERRQS
jgi:hypothetical protein